MLVEPMVSPEEQRPAEMNPPAPPHSSGGRRRGRRGGRGRGRGVRHAPQTAGTDQPAGAPAGKTIAPSLETPAAGGGYDASAISQAIDEVRHIVESLEQVLEEMEEVRELVEVAERQKSADEHEVEALRRALRRIQAPRGHKDPQHEHGRD